MQVLIVFSTKEGQTEKIAAFIAAHVRQHGHQATTQWSQTLSKDFVTAHFDAAILGGPIHMGKYPSDLKRFVHRHHEWLSHVPSAFFTVCMAINSVNATEREDAKAYGQRFIQAVNWQPDAMETFAGAVKYTHYGFFTRKLMQMISKREGGSTDTTQDHEYTDWQAVTRFTAHFLDVAAATTKTNSHAHPH